MATKKSVSNEDILELLQESMQMTAEGFERQEAWNQKQEKWNEKQQSWNEKQQSWNEKFMKEIKDIKHTLAIHDVQFAELKEAVRRISNEQAAQVADISDILDRIYALEQKQPIITQAEKQEMQSLLQHLVNWAQLAAKNLKIPLEIS